MLQQHCFLKLKPSFSVVYKLAISIKLRCNTHSQSLWVDEQGTIKVDWLSILTPFSNWMLCEAFQVPSVLTLFQHFSAKIVYVYEIKMFLE